MADNTDLYRDARGQLVVLISDYDKAVNTFTWPRLTGTLTWASDWFDVIARGPGSADRSHDTGISTEHRYEDRLS